MGIQNHGKNPDGRNSLQVNICLFASSFRGAHSRLTRTITQQKIRALFSAYRDRGRQKRYFRRLWITRINAAIRGNLVYYSYSIFIHNLYKKQLLLNRKILAQIARRESASSTMEH
ncbi:hypothetical protein ACB098_02G146600 [Castanea mollissima]